MDGNGISEFAIADADTAKVVFRDAITTVGPLAAGANYKALSLGADGSLTLRYNRGVVAPCSVLENAAKCWATLAKDRLISKELAAPVPKADLCAASYRKSKSPKDNPSIITYSTEIVLGRDGKVTTVSRG